eukprot:CAMPEP_0201255916 /NCGR_PEP_ID=MMETSP0853-20130426/263_1 /ASSEMBLY_ACC=CAM_ASM_000640 /TAXON_ID=183588 /ORGANISM="Pseudo-nitzschia fraudulenta, Strain WWA7" /LENGTH=844 /DNA_ID=CAMNT_0047555939 /DNA_START=26 /DNA_END=2560 /DNA_ORIENTATION=-
MTYDESEPPALSSSSSVPTPSPGAAPPPGAFSSLGPPPPSAFAANTETKTNTKTTPTTTATTDLNSRWKQYEAEMEGRRTHQGTTGSAPLSAPTGPPPTGPPPLPPQASHGNYNLYETPQKSKNPPGGGVPGPNTEPRRTYSFTKSGSYDTNALIAKYAGASGLAPGASPASIGLQRTLSGSRPSTVLPSTVSSTTSAIPSAARAEAERVLSMTDEQLGNTHGNASANASANAGANPPFVVRRTESGGFRASVVAPSDEGSSAGGSLAGFSFKRSGSNARRTPSALSGLGLTGSGGNGNTADWKPGRYSFRDPRFREDDFLAEEEDEILGPAVADYGDGIEVRRKAAAVGSDTSGYRDHPLESVAFEGDFPRAGGFARSSRYADAASNSDLLDRYDRSHAGKQNRASGGARQSALRSFVGTVGSNVRALGDNVSGRIGDAKSKSLPGKTFSFRTTGGTKSNHKNSNNIAANQSPARGSPSATGSTNLRTVWKDDAFRDEDDGVDDYGGGSDHKQHKTWERVAYQKKRRRKILLSVLCVLVTATVIGVSLSQTSWRWKYKNLWGGDNAHMEVTFYATSNTPLGYGTTEQQLVQDLANIPADAEFVAHLGNLQDASVGMCPAARMQEVSSLLQSRAPVPIFVVPGEHDWIRCPNQMTAFARWLKAFGTTEALEKEDSLVKGGSTTASSAGDFDRPKSTPEIFSKLHHGVLFFGLHLVHGTVTEGAGMQVQNVRDDKMAIFVRGTLDRLNGRYRSVVMLGNARPGPRQQAFFDAIRGDLSEARVPVAYVHAHSGFGETEHHPFAKSDKKKDVLGAVVGIQAASGGTNQPPLKITVGFGKKPFTVGAA